MLKQKNYRILVVDDVIGIHQDFKKILNPDSVSLKRLDEFNEVLLGKSVSQNEGLPPYELDFAYQSKEALILVKLSVDQNKPFAVAFVDVQMPPGEDGVETISKMWKLDPNIQIVISTAYSNYNWKDFKNRFGETDQLLLLKKPFDKQEILVLASTLVKRWNLNKEIYQKYSREQDQPLELNESSTTIVDDDLESKSLKDAAKALAALNEKLKNIKL
jgi:CheY-like chemotaxis protein